MNFAIILNYINFKQTMECCTQLLQLNFEKVIIIENGSNNNSMAMLKRAFEKFEKVIILRSDENIGYAKGNNSGLKYLSENYNSNDNVVFIINPDSIVDKKIIDDVSSYIRKTPNAGAVTGLMNGTSQSIWHHMSLGRSLIFNSWTLRGALNKFDISEHVGYKDIPHESNFPVDIVVGAFFGIAQSVMEKVNFFDEGTFLYYEEDALAARLGKNGYQNYLLPDESFEHVGGSSTVTTGSKILSIESKSRIYVARKYYGANSMFSIICKIENLFDKIIFRLFRP